MDADRDEIMAGAEKVRQQIKEERERVRADNEARYGNPKGPYIMTPEEVLAKVRRAQASAAREAAFECPQGRAIDSQTTYGGIAGGRTQCDEQQAHTSREEAIRNASYHGEMATKSYQAAAFFEANPAFEEFVRLIRCGAIQL